MEHWEQRKHPRFACGGIADVMILGKAAHCPARILDLSREGCLLALQRPMPVEAETAVELTFTANQLPFRVRAQVRSVRSEKQVGFQFDQLSRRTINQLEDLVGELKEANRKLPDRRTVSA